MPLTTTADVEALLQVDIEPDDHPKVQALLEMATELITAELGRNPEAEDVTETLFARPVGPLVFLNRWPIASVATLSEDGTALVLDDDYRADLPTGTLVRVSSAYPRNWPGGVPIAAAYTTAVIPGLRTICAAMVARAIKAGQANAAAPALLLGLKQLTIGRWSGTSDTTKGTGVGDAIYLTDVERATVHSWRERRSS